MSLPEWAFAIVALVGSIAAIGMVTTKNVVHGALYLVVTLGTVGAAYLILAAEFVAWVQVVSVWPSGRRTSLFPGLGCVGGAGAGCPRTNALTASP